MSTGHVSQLLNEIFLKEEAIKPPVFGPNSNHKTKVSEYSLKFRVPTLFTKLDYWGVLLDQSNIAGISADAVKSLAHKLFDCFVMATKTLLSTKENAREFERVRKKALQLNSFFI